MMADSKKLYIGLGNSVTKLARIGAKKEKKRETPIRSLPHYIRDTERQRQSLAFPAKHLSRH
jgi:hypothetical protein